MGGFMIFGSHMFRSHHFAYFLLTVFAAMVSILELLCFITELHI